MSTLKKKAKNRDQKKKKTGIQYKGSLEHSESGHAKLKLKLNVCLPCKEVKCLTMFKYMGTLKTCF